jgi:hypothetical protein
MGCYVDSNDRIMGSPIETDDPQNSPATCTRKCFEKGYKMAGPQVSKRS